ncbi:MAG: ABC transporter permease [Planctomycetota bacterium]
MSSRSGGEARRFRTLLWALVVREIKGRYRRSLLGPAWAVVQPLGYLLIFLMLRGVLGVRGDGTPYAVFAMAALVPWTFFSNAVAWCGPSILANAGIVKKIAVPRIVFPTAYVAASLVDFVIGGVLLAGVLAWHRVTPGVTLLWVPVLAFLTAILALGVGLFFAALGTYKRDFIFVVPFIMQFGVLASPVMYPVEKVPAAWWGVYQWNPMVGILVGFRNTLIAGTAPDPRLLAISIAGILAIWLVTYPLFRYMSQYFADVV